jgi:CBS domain-containing protein
MMKVTDIMTRDVVTVAPGTSIKAVARLLVDRRISGVPVVDEDGTVLGVVSEGDILVKEHEGHGPASLLGHLLDWDEAERLKHTARDAADAMTSPAVTIRPARPVHEAAGKMLDRGVNRLPVVDDNGRLVGIVTRADLVRAFVRSDHEIEREIRDDVLVRVLWASPDRFAIKVDSGEVTIEGRMADAESEQLLRRLVERVPGVVQVRSRITWPV